MLVQKPRSALLFCRSWRPLCCAWVWPVATTSLRLRWTPRISESSRLPGQASSFRIRSKSQLGLQNGSSGWPSRHLVPSANRPLSRPDRRTTYAIEPMTKVSTSYTMVRIQCSNLQLRARWLPCWGSSNYGEIFLNVQNAKVLAMAHSIQNYSACGLRSSSGIVNSLWAFS
jgi:hypothetical protein